MSPEQFRRWRERHFTNRVNAARALGISPVMVRLYERGRRWDRGQEAVVIPRTVELACHAIDQLGGAIGAHRFRYDN